MSPAEDRGPDPGPEPRTSLAELAGLFLRLGLTAFGGPAAHVAMMQDEVVSRRRWLSEQRFLDLVGATNLIPGPNSTELAIHIGWARRRWAGLALAGLCFLLPAVLITGTLAWAYVRYGSLPAVSGFLRGVAPAILGVIVQAIWRLSKPAARTWGLRVLGALAFALVASGAGELQVLFGAGVVAMLASGSRGARAAGSLAPVLPFAPVLGQATASAAGAATPGTLFWIFLKIGSVLFGSGYVLFAFVRAELVERRGWLTEPQLVDAIAAGQVTPGPVFSSATFLGYVLAGPWGAVAATVGIFLPAFLFVAASGPLVPRLRGSAAAGAFLDGVNVASLALMAYVTFQLARSALTDAISVALAVAAAFVLIRWKWNASWIVLAGGAIGWALQAWRR